jgi:hypothetical protein
MALLYPWATKEYLLWEMSLGQIIMYHNLGIEQKYGKQNRKPKKASEMSHEELKALRETLAAQFGDIGGTTDG